MKPGIKQLRRYFNEARTYKLLLQTQLAALHAVECIGSKPCMLFSSGMLHHLDNVNCKCENSVGLQFRFVHFCIVFILLSYWFPFPHRVCKISRVRLD